MYRGIVVTGDGVAGRDLGVPTANLDLKNIKLEPGIYAAYTEHDGIKHRSTVCYGAGDPMKFEVHLFDFDDDILGDEISVEIIEQVSEFMPWTSMERMRQKVLHDLEMAAQLFDQIGDRDEE